MFSTQRTEARSQRAEGLRQRWKALWRFQGWRPGRGDSAEELLRSLDLEIGRRRAERNEGSSQRAAVLAGGLLLILGGMAVALCALFSSLSGLSQGPQAHAAPAEAWSQR